MAHGAEGEEREKIVGDSRKTSVKRENAKKQAKSLLFYHYYIFTLYLNSFGDTP